MHFFGLSVLALALASMTDAAPAVSERGLRVPRAPHQEMKRAQSTETTVTDTTIEQDINGQETLFEKKVTQIIVQNSGNTNTKNNKRKASMDTTVNTVIQVVQVIIDQSSNSKRYAVSAILADNGSDQTMTCQITAAQTYTVGNGTCAGVAAATDGSAAVLSDATATATAIQAGATGGLSAPFNMANQTVLLPANASAPEAAAGVMVMADPAAAVATGGVLTC